MTYFSVKQTEQGKISDDNFLMLLESVDAEFDEWTDSELFDLDDTPHKFLEDRLDCRKIY